MAAAAAAEGEGEQKRNGFSLNLKLVSNFNQTSTYVCVFFGEGGGGASRSSHTCLHFFNLTDRVGILWGRDRGRAVAGGNKWAKKVYFVRDNSLSFIIHRQVHP